MTEETVRQTDPFEAFVAAEGLSAKVEVIAAQPEALLTDAAIARAEAIDGTGPQAGRLHAGLLAFCRDQGLEAGPAGFGNSLIAWWMGFEDLETKIAVLAVWTDPLLSDFVANGLAVAADEETDPDRAARLTWHARLVARCRVDGITAGARDHAANDGPVPPAGSALENSDPQAMIADLNALLGKDDPESVARRIALAERLLGPLPKDGPDVLLAYRAELNAQLAADLVGAWQMGLIAKQQVPALLTRGHALYAEAIALFLRLGHDFEAAATAQNQALLYWREFESGVTGAALKAHALYEEALTLFRRLGLDVEVAQTSSNWANLYSTQFVAGDAGAAETAHTLYAEGLEIHRRLGPETEVASVAMNWGTLYQAEAEAAVPGAAEKAHALYAEALEIRRRLGPETEVARVASNWGNLYQTEAEARVPGAASKAHALYAEALEICRRLELQTEVARVAANWGAIYQTEAEAGVPDAASRAHALYETALTLLHRLGWAVEVAKVTQNQAALYARQFEAGDAGAAAKAHALFDAAFDALPAGAPLVERLRIRRNRLRLFETEGRWEDVVALAWDLLAEARAALGALPTRSARNRLLTSVAGVGQRGAAAALQTGDLTLALRLLEAGRAQQLGARLREAEAALAPEDRKTLDATRAAWEAAQRRAARASDEVTAAIAEQVAADSDAERAKAIAAAEAARAAQKAAENGLAAAHSTLTGRLAESSLNNVDVAPPSAEDLREALGSATLVVPWYGRDIGGVLLLTPGRDDWQRIDLPGLTRSVAGSLSNDQLTFSRRRFPSFSRGMDRETTTALMADIPVASADLHAWLGAEDGLWGRLMGPLTRALSTAGIAPAEVAETAPEIVIVPPPELAVLPLAAARNPETGRRVLEDYALRFVPGLHAVVTAAARAQRKAPATALAVTNPLDDLQHNWPGGKETLDPTHTLDDDRDLEIHRLTGYRGDPQNSAVATWDGMRDTVEKAEPGWLVYLGHSHWDQRDSELSGACLAAPLKEDGAIPSGTDARGRSCTAIDLATPARIRSLALGNTRLVVSGSCSGAGISLREAPDEFAGLATSYFEAGAAGVVASLYVVGRDETVELMRHVLNRCLAGEEPVQALRRAQITALETVANRPMVNLRDETSGQAFDTTGAPVSTDPQTTDPAKPIPGTHDILAFALIGQ